MAGDEIALWVDGSPLDAGQLTVDTLGSFLDRVAEGLGQVTDLVKARNLVALATAVAELSRLQKAATDTRQQADRLVVLATWRLGELAAEARAAGRLAGRGGRRNPATITAGDLGVNSRKLAAAEQLAAHPLSAVEAVVAAKTEAGGVVTTAGTLRQLGDPASGAGMIDRRIGMTAAQWAKVDGKAAERGWTQSEVMRRLVDRMV